MKNYIIGAGVLALTGFAFVFGVGIGANKMNEVIISNDIKALKAGWKYRLLDGYPVWEERRMARDYGEAMDAAGAVNGS